MGRLGGEVSSSLPSAHSERPGCSPPGCGNYRLYIGKGANSARSARLVVFADRSTVQRVFFHYLPASRHYPPGFPGYVLAFDRQLLGLHYPLTFRHYPVIFCRCSYHFRRICGFLHFLSTLFHHFSVHYRHPTVSLFCLFVFNYWLVLIHYLHKLRHCTATIFS